MNDRHTGLLAAASTCFGKFVGDGLLPCALGCLHLLAWLPMINAVGMANWSLGFVALVPPCAFLFTAALAVAFVQDALDGADIPVHLLSAATPTLSVAGCLAEIPAGGVLSQTLALALFGAAYGTAATLWFRDAMCHKAATLAVALLAGTAVCTGISAIALHWGTGPACFIATVGVATSSASRPHPVQAGGDRGTTSRKSSISKLLELTTSRLAMRHVTAFFALGLLTGAMLTMFTMGMPDPDIGAVGAGLPAGALALALLVGIGWAINREPSFTHSFEFSFLVALLAFFPFYPGTPFNQQLSLVLGSTWATVLVGLALLVSYEISLACAPTQKCLFGAAFSAHGNGMRGCWDGCHTWICLVHRDGSGLLPSHHVRYHRGGMRHRLIVRVQQYPSQTQPGARRAPCRSGQVCIACAAGVAPGDHHRGPWRID